MNWYSTIKQHELNASEAQNHQLEVGQLRSIRAEHRKGYAPQFNRWWLWLFLLFSRK